MATTEVPCSVCDEPLDDGGYCTNCGASLTAPGKWLIRREWGRRFLVSEIPDWGLWLIAILVVGGALLLVAGAMRLVIDWLSGDLV